VRDIDAIRTYLEGQRVSAAVNFGERLEETWDILGRMPLLGRPARSQRLLRKGYRTFVMDEYFLYYKVQTSGIEIYRVKHAAREFREGIG
jgi:plasmid stabilization system protein ParE